MRRCAGRSASRSVLIAEPTALRDEVARPRLDAAPRPRRATPCTTAGSLSPGAMARSRAAPPAVGRVLLLDARELGRARRVADADHDGEVGEGVAVEVAGQEAGARTGIDFHRAFEQAGSIVGLTSSGSGTSSDAGAVSPGTADGSDTLSSGVGASASVLAAPDRRGAPATASASRKTTRGAKPHRGRQDNAGADHTIHPGGYESESTASGATAGRPAPSCG